MNLILIRKDFLNSGIFGSLKKEDGSELCISLERSYLKDDKFEPKLPIGVYECKKGKHTLGNGMEIITFEILNVPGHTGILFHVGNFNEDSNGCILLGSFIGEQQNGDKMVVGSLTAFEKFMKLQSEVDNFQLTVK